VNNNYITRIKELFRWMSVAQIITWHLYGILLVCAIKH